MHPVAVDCDGVTRFDPDTLSDLVSDDVVFQLDVDGVLNDNTVALSRVDHGVADQTIAAGGVFELDRRLVSLLLRAVVDLNVVHHQAAPSVCEIWLKEV